MNDFNDFNRQVIAEFRANGGKVGGGFEGAPMVLLTTTGRKSGEPRTVPLVYLDDDGIVTVFGSKGGAPSHPDWYLNLQADPTATVELGEDSFQATAQFVEGAERDEIYGRQAELMPGFAEYQANTDRVIPVVRLSRG